MNGVEQLEVLEEIVTWVCEIGMCKFDNILQQLYGLSLNEFNESIGRKPHLYKNKSDYEVFDDEETQNYFNLDVIRLREDIRCFYIEMEDTEQLEVLKETLRWACEVRIKENNRFQYLYGLSLNQFNESVAKRPRKNGYFELNFEKMTDMELLCELREFYEKYDPQKLKKLHKLLDFARKIGRTEMNNNLLLIYNQRLQPIFYQKIELPPVFSKT